MQINPAVPVPAWQGVSRQVNARFSIQINSGQSRRDRLRLGVATRGKARILPNNRTSARQVRLRLGSSRRVAAGQDCASQGGFGPLTVYPVPASRDVSRRGEAGRGIESHHKEFLSDGT